MAEPSAVVFPRTDSTVSLELEDVDDTLGNDDIQVNGNACAACPLLTLLPLELLALCFFPSDRTIENWRALLLTCRAMRDMGHSTQRFLTLRVESLPHVIDLYEGNSWCCLFWVIP
jgi:hypothetical protein